MEGDSFGRNDPLLLNDIPSGNVLSSDTARVKLSLADMPLSIHHVYSRERCGVGAARSGLLDLVETSQLSNGLVGRRRELDVLKEKQGDQHVNI
jgi:hypothetical protein